MSRFRRRQMLAAAVVPGGGGPTPVPMPTGYTQVEYIDSNGSQYINTGVTAAATASSELDILFLVTTGGPYTVLSDGSGTYGTNYGQYNGVFSIFSSYLTSAPSDVRTKVRCYIDGNQYVDADGSVISFPYNGSTSPYLLFGDAGWMGSPGSVRFFEGKFYENGVLVRDFIPCRDANNVGYLYDAVNDVIYQNSGSGSFGLGPDVS